MLTQVLMRVSRSRATTSSIAASSRYHPATHQAGGPATHQYPPGRPAAQVTAAPMHRSVPSQAQPQAAASTTDTDAVRRQRKPHAIATATSGAIRGLRTSPTGLTR